jgi:hypothetical protein
MILVSFSLSAGRPSGAPIGQDGQIQKFCADFRGGCLLPQVPVGSPGHASGPRRAWTHADLITDGNVTTHLSRSITEEATDGRRRHIGDRFQQHGHDQGPEAQTARSLSIAGLASVNSNEMGWLSCGSTAET